MKQSLAADIIVALNEEGERCVDGHQIGGNIDGRQSSYDCEEAEEGKEQGGECEELHLGRLFAVLDMCGVKCRESARGTRCATRN